jgi:N-sulfoglucosamine sulfohydrolase
MNGNSMNRRDFMKGCAASTSVLVGSALVSQRAAARGNTRPNVVLIVSDDHGRETLGCYGNPVVRTPNLDTLAAEGVRFTNAFCTTASCSASRSVILSGMYNHANGQYGHQHSYHHFISFDNFKTLPVWLTEAGYRTGRIGKYHVAPEEVYQFDVALPGNSRSPVQMADNCRDFISSSVNLSFCTFARAILIVGAALRKIYPAGPTGSGTGPRAATPVLKRSHTIRRT